MNASATFDLSSIANLARLELSEKERESLRSDMRDIVGYIDLLSELDVDGIEPTAHAVTLTNVLRTDKAEISRDRAPFMANAPATIDDELLKVPKVIEK